MNKRQKKKFIKKGNHKKFWKVYEIIYFPTDENDMIHYIIRKGRILKAHRYVDVQFGRCDCNMPSPKEEKEISIEFTSGNYLAHTQEILEKAKNEILETSKNLTYDFSNIKKSLDEGLSKYKKDSIFNFPNTSKDNMPIQINCTEKEESPIVSYYKTWINGIK